MTYPAGWDAVEVKKTCGTSAGRYELGECGLRWAYLLAVIGCLDAIILAALAFILATRHVRLQAEPGYTANGSLYKGKYTVILQKNSLHPPVVTNLTLINNISSDYYGQKGK